MKIFTCIKVTLIIALSGAMTLKAQKGIQFDGVNDGINFGAMPVFNITDSLTVEAKIKVNGSINYPTFISNFQDSSGFWKGYWLGGDNTGKATWYIGTVSTPSAGYWLNSSTNINDGNWHHIAGTYKADTAKLFIDGVLETFTYVPNAHPYSTYSLIAGNDVFNDLYGGAIDDIRIWNSTRTTTQIAMYKDSCLKGNENKLVALYHFERGVNGSVVYDVTANGNNGKLINADTLNAWVSGTACKACDVYTISNVVSQAGLNLTSNQSGALYRWLDCANSYSFITGATSQSYSVMTNGNYAVEVNRYNCIDTSNCINITSVGIIEISKSNSASIYPSPAKDKLIVSFTEEQALIHVAIQDLAGKSLLSENYSHSNKVEINLTMPKGVYLLRIESDNKTSTHKLLIE